MEQLSSRLNCSFSFSLNELFVLRRSLKCGGGGLAVGDGLCYLVKISRAHEPLVPAAV